MSATVTIVDYGCGNLFSIARALETVGGTAEVSSDPEQATNAERLILPGVGAFGRAVDELGSHGMKDAVLKFVQTGRPFLGICVGMQMLFDSSAEFGSHTGLGLIPGNVQPIPETKCDGSRHPVPHIGWNKLSRGEADWNGSILNGLSANDSVYFVHSFYGQFSDPAHCLATCDYNGRNLTAAVSRDNITGLQFHPEKSGPTGLDILKRFVNNT
jgi:glutamine amidotransferase